MVDRSKILGSKEIDRKINRLAWEIYEDNILESKIFLIGISGRGEELSRRISETISNISSLKVELGTISLDKDFPYENPVIVSFNRADYTNQIIILVDDVLNSGKTLMYASKHFLTTSLGKLSTAVLVERTHSRFPIKANYVGLSLATTLQEYITVNLDGDGEGVYLS